MELLISVVGEHEVEAAVSGHADIVDVKNPREGSLGANFPHVIRRVREITPTEIPVSAAIGDFPNLPGMAALAAAGAAGCGVQYVKVGLLGPRDHDEAFALLSAVCRAGRDQDPRVRIMATAYADARKTGSLPPLELPAVAAEAGADGCMIDTALKSGGTLLTELGAAELESFVARCREAGLLCALAGLAARRRHAAPARAGAGHRRISWRRLSRWPQGRERRPRRLCCGSRTWSRKPDPFRPPSLEQLGQPLGAFAIDDPQVVGGIGGQQSGQATSTPGEEASSATVIAPAGADAGVAARLAMPWRSFRSTRRRAPTCPVSHAAMESEVTDQL